MASDALAEITNDPFAEICRRLLRILQPKILRVPSPEQPEKTIENDLAWKTVGISLERIRREHSVHVHHGFALMLGQLARKQTIDQILDLWISKMQPMPRAVAKKTIMPNACAHDSPGFVLFFHDHVVLAEMVGTGKAGKARAKD